MILFYNRKMMNDNEIQKTQVLQSYLFRKLRHPPQSFDPKNSNLRQYECV